MNEKPNPGPAEAPKDTNMFQKMWDTRPVRLPDPSSGSTKVAGVCEGIAVRYDIDPTLVRVAFVVAALFGGGFVMYLILWAVLPKYSLPKSPLELALENIDSTAPNAEALKSEKNTFWFLLIAVLLFSGALGSDETIFRSGFIGVLVLTLLAWWGLDSRTPNPPSGLYAGNSARQEGRPVDLSGYAPAEGAEAPFTPPTPPSWDPLGTNPELWHLPEPGPAPEPEPKKKMKFSASLPFFVGFGVILLFTSVGFGFVYKADGDATYIPRSYAELESSYTNDVGDTILDLRELTPEEGETVNLHISRDVGSISIYLPEDIPVQLDCTTDVGSTDCPSGTVNPTSKSRPINIKAKVDVGNITAN